MLYDALVVPDGGEQALPSDPDAVRFLTEALRHGKPVAVLGSGVELCRAGRDRRPGRVGRRRGVPACRSGRAVVPGRVRPAGRTHPFPAQ
ncbi:hypothetical protein [Kitasatospora sp. NPDC001132]